MLACEMLGAMLLHRNNFVHASLRLQDWREAGTLGYGIACSGEDGIHAALDEITKRADTNSGKAGPRAIYGRIGKLAFARREVDALLDRIGALSIIVIDQGEHIGLVVACKRTGRSTGEIWVSIWWRKTGLFPKCVRSGSTLPCSVLIRYEEELQGSEVENRVLQRLFAIPKR